MSIKSWRNPDTRRVGVRGLIACGFTFVALLGFWGVHAYAEASGVDVEFYRPGALAFLQGFLVGSMVVIAGLAWLCLRVMNASVEPPWMTSLLTTAISSMYIVLGICYGFYTTPVGLVMMGVLAFGLVFFDRRAVLAGFVVSVVLFAGNELLMLLHVLPYAPLLAKSPFIGTTTQLAPWWGLHFRVILYAAFLIFFGILLFQVEQLERQRRALHDLAVTDPLTKVSNRRRFNERLDEEISRRERSGRPFCVILCDADHFKKVNDTWGHHVGDEVLKFLAGVLAAGVRAEIDVVGRLGGEEFGIILSETLLAQGIEVAERIGQQMRAHEFSSGENRFRVTISMGLVECIRGNGDDALRVADELLYRAKHEGRDRVISGFVD